MRHVVFILDRLVGGSEPSPFLRESALARLAESGEVFRVPACPVAAVPEAQWLGMRPNEVDLAQGPLVVAALGADPPPRSLHFHLSLLSVDDEGLSVVETPPEADLRVILAAAQRLDTGTLTLVSGFGVDHGLVLQGLGDVGTFAPPEAAELGWARSLPEGDFEPALRRYLDDSVNLLSELEINRRRLDEGRRPWNVLWPWGAGVRRDVPNLGVRYGAPVAVESASIRLAGLSRLAGLRHGAFAGFGAGVRVPFGALAALVEAETAVLAVMEAPETTDERAWWLAEFDRRVLGPILDGETADPAVVTVLAPGQAGGIGLLCQPGRAGSNPVPFDERILGDRGVAEIDLDAAVRSGLVIE